MTEPTREALIKARELLAADPQIWFHGSSADEGVARIARYIDERNRKEAIAEALAERDRLLVALGRIAAECMIPLGTDKQMYARWRKLAVDRVDIARAALAAHNAAIEAAADECVDQIKPDDIQAAILSLKKGPKP